MEWIYLSPHLDDVALSCGGLVWEQSRAGQQVSIFTICAGDPPHSEYSQYVSSLHARWKTGAQAIRMRRQEDLVSCQHMGAVAHHLAIPDCIYRRGGANDQPLYTSDESIFGSLRLEEIGLVDELAAMLTAIIPAEACVVSPLALGHHVDHNLTRQAAEILGLRLWYYADYPYVLKDADKLVQLERAGWGWRLFPLKEQSVDIWLEAIAAHASQISTFWPDHASMRTAIQTYTLSNQGVRLWQPPGRN